MKNSKRLITRIVKEICSENKISCESFSYDWIFRLSKNDKVAHIFGYQFEKNSATSNLICSDKSSTSDLLIFNRIPVVEHFFFMSPTNIQYVGADGNWVKLCNLLSQYGKLVCKSNEGTGGNNVYLVTNQFELENAAHKIFNNSRAMAVCPFYEIDREFRVVVLDEKVKLIYQKIIPFLLGNGVSNLQYLLLEYYLKHAATSFDFKFSEEDSLKVLNIGEKFCLNWKHNLGQGADPVIVQDEKLIEYLSNLALCAAKAVNVSFSSVDIVKIGDKYLVLEINSGVMMESFSQSSDSNYQTAKSIYKKAIESMLR